MIIATTPEIAGMQTTRTIGMVQANSVRARRAGGRGDIMAGIRHVVGGEITEYTKLLADSREMTISRMSRRAEEMGANAILSTRFITAGIMGGSTEILVYGTAAMVEPDSPSD